MGKSQTLPRNLGSRSQPNIASAMGGRPIKPTSTPPAVKRQLSGPSSSPIHKTSSSKSSSKGTHKSHKSANLKGIDAKLAQMILDEIQDGGPVIKWDDIAGQQVSIKFLKKRIEFRY